MRIATAITISFIVHRLLTLYQKSRLYGFVKFMELDLL